MRTEQTLNTANAPACTPSFHLKEEGGFTLAFLPQEEPFSDSIIFHNQSWLITKWLSLIVRTTMMVLGVACFQLVHAQNPIDGNEGFQILSEGNLTFTGYTHVHGPLGIGGDLTLNANGVLAEICMDGVGSYVFPGDGSITTGLLVKGGVTWTAGGAKVMGGKYMHIGNSAGCTQSDNGVNMATQVLPTGASYNNPKRIEGAQDQTPSPAVFQTGGLDFSTMFSNYRNVSEGLSTCANNVQLYNSSNVAISGNNVTSLQNVQINSLINGVNHLDLTQTSLNNITELKFNNGAMPSASKLVVITVPLTSNFVWNNSNLPGLSGTNHGKYILWNFSGTTSYNLTINTASLIIGTIFAPNHHLIKTGTGDIDGNLFAKSMILGVGEVHFFPFDGDVPTCCSSLTSAGAIGSNQSGCGTSFDPALLTETTPPSGGSGTLEYQWQSSSNNSTWMDISGATSQTYDPPSVSSTTYYRRGARRSGCTTYLYSNSITATVISCVEICDNSIDDDGDGLVDCADNDCMSVSTPGWQNATYKTISDGNWTNSSTWLNGNKPGFEDLSNKTILIQHDITLNGQNIKLLNGSKIWVLGRSLILSGGNFIVENGFLEVVNGSLETTTGNISLSSSAATMIIVNSTLSSGQNFSNDEGKRKLVNTCLMIGENFSNTGTDTLLNVCASIGINTSGNGLENSGNTYVLQSKFNVVNGNFTNQSGSVLSGSDLVIWVHTGNLENGGTWQASVQEYCIGGNISIPSGYRPVSENCGGISALVESCECSCSESEICNNGLDDDGDGLIDCADGDCPLPSVSVSGTNSICIGTTTTLTASGGGAYVWSNGGLSAGISVTPSSTTTYTVTVTSANGCTATASRTVTVSNLPNATISGTNNICVGSSTTFTASGGTSYVWNTGVTTPSINITPASTTAFTVTVTNASGCTATATRTVTVNQNPTANISGVNSICVGSSTTLNAGGGVSYQWSTGSSSTNITVSPNSTTTYSVTVTNSSGCTATANRTVTVNAKPNANISGVNEICAGKDSDLTASGGGTYAWNTGATGANITVSPASNTTYIITVTNSNGCTDTDNHAVTVNANPSATISGTNTICYGENTTLTANGNSSYSWLWSNGATSKSINVSPLSTTTYSVTITNGNGCTATASNTVTVNSNPTALISGVNTICNGTSTVLSANGGGTYQWSNGSSASNITVSPSSSTTYSVTVTNGSGCTATASLLVTVNALPSVSVSGTNTVCEGGTTTLIASGGTSYVWNTGASLPSIDVSPVSNTTYSVTVTNANGCTSTGSRTVTVVADPLISSQPNGGSICPGQTFSLSAAATGGTPSLTYQWQSSTNNSTFANISGATSSNYTTPALSVTTYYRVVASATGSGCGSATSNSATVTNVPLPIANAGADFSVCLGASGILSASGGVGYIWNNGLGSGAVKTISPTTPTTYTVTVSNILGCTTTDQVDVSISDPVYVNLGVDKTVCNGGSVTMTAIGTDGVAPYTYEWSHGLGITNSKTVSPTATTTYMVTVTDSKGCTDVDDILVTVSQTCLENCSNGIDDDGDGLRDCFDMDCPCYAPFICDGKMYQTIRLNSYVSGLGSEGDYILYEVKSNPVALTPIANLNNNGLAGEINSFGYNQIDRFIYGISEDPPYNVYRLNANYDVHTLGTITGISSSYGKLWAADFDRNGYYYVIATKTNSNASGPSSNQKIYRINLSTLVATEVYDFNEYVGMSDIAFNPVDNMFYGWHGPNHKLMKINPSNWSSTSIGSANYGFDRMISTFFDSEGSLIAYADNNSIGGSATYETLVKVNVATGVVTQIGTGLTTDNGDGCSCPYHVRFTKQGPATAASNSTITYTFRIFNQSGLVLNNIAFRDTLPAGFTFSSNAQNVNGGISISGTAAGQQIAALTINGIPNGTSTFTLGVQIPACSVSGTTLSNQAWLEDFNLVTDALPAKIYSDDINTAIIGDPTTTTINCEICNNGIDDDGDGLIDGNDPDCCTLTVSLGNNKSICEGETTSIAANIGGAGAGSGTCSGTTISSYPYSESFENTLGDWTQSSSDNFDWEVDALGTPSSSTGPTLAANGIYYLYVESSSPNYPSKTTIINSPCFDLGSAGTASFSFSYHMYGSDMGSLYFEISENNGSTWTTLWSASGNKGNTWLNQTVNFNSYAGKTVKARFRAVTGSGYLGDMAIDNIGLTTTSAVASYLWSNGSTASAINVNPTSTTTYSVTVTKGICSVTDQMTVTVNAKPNAAITGPTTVCIGNSGTLTASGGGTYLWSTGATSSAITVAPLLPTTYTVTVTSSNGCTATASQTVSMGICTENCTNGIDDDGDGLVDCADPDCGGSPVPNAGADASVCPGSSTTISASATGGMLPYTFNWSNGLGSGANKSVSPTGATIYTVTVTSLTGCTASDVVTVSVLDAPTAAAGNNVAICSGVDAGLIATATGGLPPYNYVWSNGLGAGASQTVSPVSNTSYIVTVTDNNGCTDTDQATIVVNQTPVANAGADVTICSSFNTTINASALGGTTPYTYLWNNGLGIGASHTISPSSTRTYSVTVVSSNGCVDTDQVTVTVQNCPENCTNGIDDDGDGFIDCADSGCGPQVDLGGGISICSGSSASLSAAVVGGNGGLTYTWSNGLGSGQNKTVTPTATTTYSVTVSSSSGCTDAAQVTVTVNICSEDCTNGIDDDGDGLIDCDDPDCSGVTAPVLVDDSFTTCPGMTFTERVTYNDGNLQSPNFSISAQPVSGLVSIDWTGKFIYLPMSSQCTTDFFIYEVCNGTTGCCSEATVTMNFGDNTPPVLSNVPVDITIGCDDALPLPGTVTAFDQCPGVFIDYQTTSDQTYQGACGSYTITRTWTATDLCGNTSSDQQKILVLDQTKPEIFQVYTLANGAKVVAGVSQRVTEDWKYVPFPISFSQAPIVFTTVVTNTDFSAVSVQERNIYTQGFEMRVREEENADHIHVSEKVAWLAIEPGSQTGDFSFQAGTFANAGHEWDTLNFSSVFSDAPLLFTSLQTTKEKDPVTIRQRNLSSNSVEFFAQEETSLDAETNHQNETLGILAIDRNDQMVDREGEQFGEMGQIYLTNAWTTVSLNRKYTKPVVIVGGLTNIDTDPVNIRVRNVTGTSFQLRVQEWDYLDGNHGTESVSWMVVEGSIPGNGAFYCAGNAAELRPGVNVFAMDNCDDIVAFGYNESPSAQTGGGLLTVRSWMAIDDCGNTNLVTRYDTCATAALQIKASLYGAVMNSNGVPGLMRDDLREQKKIPVFEPYSTLPAFNHIEYAEHILLPQGNGGGNTGTPDITICHKPGTADEVTMTVPVSELALHLGHGDMIGSCGSNTSGLVTICHKPGTPAQKTMVIPQAALLGHLGHGDIIGDCGGGVSEVNSAAQSADYRTVADGLWTDAATWESGNVPPTTNITNKTISVEHKVTIQNSDLDMGNNSTLWVTHGSLTLLNGVFKIEKSAAYFSQSVFDMTTAGNVEINSNQGILSFADCTVMVGQSIKNQGGKLKLENVSLNVSEDFENLGGKDSLINVCAVIQGNFKSFSLSSNYFSNVKMQLPNGGFENFLLSSVTGDGLVLLVESGILSNLGTWTAPILQYCVAGSLSGLLSSVLPGSQDCVDIANNFNPCNCDDDDHVIDNAGGGSNPVSGTTTATDDDQTVNHGNSFGGGSIEPSVLDIEGDDAVVDWLLVELRNPDDEKVVMGYATVLLQKDGRVVGENLDSTIAFPGLPEGDYYVAIRHRNHLGMMTDVPFYLSSQNIPEIDFTDLSLPVRGGNIGGKLSSGKRTMWSGDFSEDGKVIYQGPYNDVFNLFSKVLSQPENAENLANYIVQGYELEDLNLDGKVIFQGPNNDRFTLLYHTILSHPLNVNNLANYIVKMP